MGLTSVEVVMDIEAEFEVELSDEDVDRVWSAGTVQSLGDLVFSKVSPSTDAAELHAKVRNIIAVNLGVPVERVMPETKLREVDW